MEQVLEYLEAVCARTPDRIAVACRDVRYSFAAFRDLAARLGGAIPRRLKNQPICVIADRSAETAILFVAVLYSGNYYIPLDPQMPTAKRQSILDEACPEVILGTQEQSIALEGLDYDGLYLTVADAEDAPCPFPTVGGDDPLYMVYTSGSTGKPKGVLKSHRAEISFLEAYCAEFGFDDQEIIGNQTPFFFDAAGKDFYLMLKTGARLEVIPTELFAMPTMLVEYLNEKKITFLSWVPTALSVVAQLRTFSYVRPETVRRVFFVGEVMPMKHLNYWRKYLPDVCFVNLYGSSELAGICCYYRVEREFENDQNLPMGKPLGNCKIYLMDGERQITEPGKVGEIYVVSPALALEYYRDPEKTAACFPVRDFGNGPRRCYKSGDLASYDGDGNLIFAARSDFQIKHMGRRIELGEIETVAGALPDVARCCCLYDQKKSRIILFCQLSAEAEAKTGTEIQSQLRSRLSSYMLPSKVHVLDRLPLNANGKIDRQALKQQLG